MTEVRVLRGQRVLVLLVVVVVAAVGLVLALLRGGPRARAGETRVAPAAASAHLFADTAQPAVDAFNDGHSVELGVRFSSSVPGRVTAIRFFKGAGNTGTHTGALWTRDGRRLASVTFNAETASGWQ